jgi:hypothetical protein
LYQTYTKAKTNGEKEKEILRQFGGALENKNSLLFPHKS